MKTRSSISRDRRASRQSGGLGKGRRQTSYETLAEIADWRRIGLHDKYADATMVRANRQPVTRTSSTQARTYRHVERGSGHEHEMTATPDGLFRESVDTYLPVFFRAASCFVRLVCPKVTLLTTDSPSPRLFCITTVSSRNKRVAAHRPRERFHVSGVDVWRPGFPGRSRFEIADDFFHVHVHRPVLGKQCVALHSVAHTSGTRHRAGARLSGNQRRLRCPNRGLGGERVVERFAGRRIRGAC